MTDPTPTPTGPARAARVTVEMPAPDGALVGLVSIVRTDEGALDAVFHEFGTVTRKDFVQVIRHFADVIQLQIDIDDLPQT